MDLQDSQTLYQRIRGENMFTNDTKNLDTVQARRYPSRRGNDPASSQQSSYIDFWTNQDGDDKDKIGISSSLMTFIKIVRNLLGLTFFIIPIGMRDFTLLGFTGVLTYALLLNLFLVWL